MILLLAISGGALAIVPALLFLSNLPLYAPLPPNDGKRRGCSVLIPARDEENNIAAALESVLQSGDVELEVIVLDDASSDRTAEIVREISRRDSRVQLQRSAQLPAGWCGKNFACQQLARLARQPNLIFMDADVRVSRPDSLGRLAQFLENNGAALVSGIPRQETVGFMEKLIIPLIHFVLLAFLPLRKMRASTAPAFGAACGQIIAVRADVYRASGGHAAIADRLHDAVALARHFRARGWMTDLFDATDTFRCRMYQNAAEVWSGFAKNAHEGLGSRALIIPATLLLLGGQVLPLFLLAIARTPAVLFATLPGIAAIFLPRLVAVRKFRQSLGGALLHPLGILVLLAIQWSALIYSLGGRRPAWKGRIYAPLAPAVSGDDDAFTKIPTVS